MTPGRMTLAALMIEAERAGLMMDVILDCHEAADPAQPFVAELWFHTTDDVHMGIEARAACPIEAIAALSRKADAAHTKLCEMGAL